MSIIKKIIKYLIIVTGLGLGIACWFIFTLFAKTDVSNEPDYYPFKSVEAKTKYLEYYKYRSQDWPVPSEVRIVETSYGKTYIRISGDEGNKPLVLLPSTNATSLIWGVNIEALSKYFRVYAIDNIYDVGCSVNIKNIDQPEDMVEWLDELFEEIFAEEKINLLGMSFGGWLTSQYTLKNPDRLDKAIWICPAATLYNFPSEWAWRGIISAIPHRFFVKKFMVEWLFNDLQNSENPKDLQLLDTLVEDAIMGMKCFTFRMPITPTVLTNSELGSIQTPTLLLIGENEKLYSSLKAVDRVKSINKTIKTVIIPNAGHDLIFVQPEIVNEKIIKFISG